MTASGRGSSVPGRGSSVPRIVADRPHMPGYGILPPEEGTGLLPWSWALERIEASRNFWIATVWPDGRPHAMPVWGVWDGAALWFSSSARSRKIINLRAEPRVVVTTEAADDPVVIEGLAEIVTAPVALRRFIDLVNSKYETGYGVEFLDPEVNVTVAVRPQWAFGLEQGDFAGSPTRWSFTG